MIDWIERELLAWGAWAARQDDGIGYPSQSPFARLTPSGSGWADTGLWERIPADLRRTHRAVMLLAPIELQVLIAWHYKHGATYRRTAGAFHRDHKTVKAWTERAQEQVAKVFAQTA